MARITFLAASTAGLASAINDGLGRTPVMGFNSWTAFGTGVSESALVGIGQFFSDNGLVKKGYNFVNTDDGWSLGSRDANGFLQADLTKFPDGIAGVVGKLSQLGINFGIYTAESSVVCSGRPGTLFNEVRDANFFAAAGVKLVKNDNCGEYSYGNARFRAFADAVASLGPSKGMIISTEPFSLIPNPEHAGFAHYWRTGNDINSDWHTILNRIDNNDKWAAYAGPGHFNDPDMLQVGNGGLTIGQQRAHFGLWALAKAPLIFGSDVRKFTQEQMALIGNTAVIAVNQDPLGIQARKVAINGTLTPRFVGVGPCHVWDGNPAYPDGVPGPNGVTKQTLTWALVPTGANYSSLPVYTLQNSGTGSVRCLGLRPYINRPTATPMLVPCTVQDSTTLWVFPTGTTQVGAIQSVWALQQGLPATALYVSNSTTVGTVHGKDEMPLLDGAYGDMVLGLAAYTPEPVCTNRGCQDYDPSQSWYYSASTGTVRLAQSAASAYRCYEPNCYQLTSHYPAYDELCLTQVLSISNYGVDPSSDSVGGWDVYGGPLQGGRWVMGVLNRGTGGGGNGTYAVTWDMLESSAITNSTAACVTELFSGTSYGVQTGGVTVTVPDQDLAVLLVDPTTTQC